MNSDPQSKAEIIARLREVQQQLRAVVQPMSAAQFERSSGASWSPAEYLKHLLLSVKPFAKALGFEPAALKRRFGEPSRPSLTYPELQARYQARLDEGIRAEDYESVTPVTYRVPEETADLQTYLLDQWDEAHSRLFTGLERWRESDLDGIQILHPALGSITVRDMLFFTIYHNNLHANDIQALA